MVDPRMYTQDHFVVLETNQPEQILTAEELLEKLKDVLAQYQDTLPTELHHLSTIEAQAQYLLETGCDFDVGPGQFLQWYAVRLEK